MFETKTNAFDVDNLWSVPIKNNIGRVCVYVLNRNNKLLGLTRPKIPKK